MANNDSFTHNFPVDTDALLSRAQRYCATAERCKADVQQLLSRLGATCEQTDAIIGKLQQHATARRSSTTKSLFRRGDD